MRQKRKTDLTSSARQQLASLRATPHFTTPN